PRLQRQSQHPALHPRARTHRVLSEARAGRLRSQQDSASRDSALMFFWMLAAALPGLFWEQGPRTAPQLKAAGIECIHVPLIVDFWRESGFCAVSTDLKEYEKLPQ